MISDRPYRKGMPQARVLEILKESSGTQFDPAVIEVFLRLVLFREGDASQDTESTGVRFESVTSKGKTYVDV